MPNPLTGDFEAVTQISGLTVNRLLASMHQNPTGGGGTGLPTLPHQGKLRVGDPGYHPSVGGVRGTAWVQLSVPAVELIHGATDRFIVEAWIRAHYDADPATSFLPEFIWGKVRAEYAISVVPPPPIYARMAWTMLRFDVIPERVFFTSATSDISADPQITDQVRAILRTRLFPKPHPLISDFKDKHFRGLVGSGESAVVHPLSLGAAVPAGDVTSVNQVFLGGRDFAVAVSREYILSLVEPTLQGLKGPLPSFTIKIKHLFGTTTATYNIVVQTATLQWSAGEFTLNLAGTAKTGSILPNASFSVQQKLVLSFNAATETLDLLPSGGPNVSVDVNGLFGGLVEGYARQLVTNQFNTRLTTALTAIRPKLQAALTQKQKLITQLKTLDSLADARFDAAEFLQEGIILRGVISLSPRQMLSVTTAKLPDLSGYTALETWVPGGRVLHYDWRWYWQTTPLPAGTPPDGSQQHDDRFLLRPTGPAPGVIHFSPNGSTPKVPSGRLCLTVKGVQVDAKTGHEVGVDNAGWAERTCVYSVPSVPPPTGSSSTTGKRPLWWLIWSTSTVGSLSDSTAHAAAAYVDAAAMPGEPFNTLVYTVPDEASARSLGALEDGLRRSARDDAGLLVVLVLREGLVERSSPELAAAINAFAERIESPVMATEDVQKSWSLALELPQGPATRLLTPDGTLAWRYDGTPDGETIAAALREHLQPSAPPRPEPIELTVAPGEEMPEFWFEEAPGVAMTLRQFQGRPLSLTFVQPWTQPCLAQLRRLQRLQEQVQRQGRTTIAVVAGIDEKGAEELAEEHGLTFPVLADPHNLVATRLGVRAWPTTVGINESGQLTAVEMGADSGALTAFTHEQREPVAVS